MTYETKNLYRSIMEATGRFEFVKEKSSGILIFWDNYWENEYSIRTDWPLDKVIQWITNFYSEDFCQRGEEKARRKFRAALGLDQ